MMNSNDLSPATSIEIKETGMTEPIFTEEEYRQALRRFIEICDMPEDTVDPDELDQLITVMEIYEEVNSTELG